MKVELSAAVTTETSTIPETNLAKSPFWPPINWDAPPSIYQPPSFGMGGLPTINLPLKPHTQAPRPTARDTLKPAVAHTTAFQTFKNTPVAVVGGNKTLNIRLDTANAGKGYVYICVNSHITVEQLFVEVQRRLSRRIGDSNIISLILRLDGESDSGAFEVDSDDAGTWKMCVKRFADQPGSEIDVLGEVVVE
jgi:hypothetical protein